MLGIFAHSEPTPVGDHQSNGTNEVTVINLKPTWSQQLKSKLLMEGVIMQRMLRLFSIQCGCMKGL